MMTLLTMGAGNVKVLKETLKSFSAVCDEVIYGDLLLFPDDRAAVEKYKTEFNLKTVKFDFDFIFKHGFSALLNTLSAIAKNDMCVYMNTSEIIDIDFGIADAIKNNPDCNSFFFTHATDPHRWFRTYNRKELQWSGLIHEELIGEYRPYHLPIFQMADLPKDTDDPFKSKVLDTVKEIVYFKQYVRLVDEPKKLGATNQGWVKFATDSYNSFKERLLIKGAGYEAFENGDYDAFMRYVYNDESFAGSRFESSTAIEYQSCEKKFLL